MSVKRIISWGFKLAGEIADSTSRRGHDKEEWEKHWPRVEGPSIIFQQLLALLHNRKTPLIASISLEALKASATAGAMIYLKRFLESPDNQIWSPSISLFAIFIFLNIVQVFAEVGKNFILACLSTRMICQLRSRVFQRLFSFPIPLLQRLESGAIMNHVHNDVDLVVNLVTGILITGVGTVFSVLSVGGVIFFLNWKAALLVISILMLGVPLIQVARSPVNRFVKRLFSLQSGLVTLLQQSIYAIKYIKAMGLENRELHRINGYLEENRILSIKITAIFQAMGPPLEFLYILIVFTSLYLCMTFFHARLTIDVLGPIIYAVLRVSKSIQQVSKSIVSIEENILAAQRLFGTLSIKGNISLDNVTGKKSVSPDISCLSLEALTFGYDPDRPVFREIHVSFQKNELIALMGESGIGKSTLCEVIMGLYDSYGGRILIDNMDLRGIHIPSYRKILGYVPQEPLLIRGTIRENLLFGISAEVGEDQLVTALKKASSYDFVMKLQGGLEAVINERGVNLSGGERQRLCLARALLKNPQILILDEATAAVDRENERLILDVLSQLKKDMIVLFVTHRLTVHEFADRTFLLEGGQLRELKIIAAPPGQNGNNRTNNE